MQHLQCSSGVGQHPWAKPHNHLTKAAGTKRTPVPQAHVWRSAAASTRDRGVQRGAAPFAKAVFVWEGQLWTASSNRIWAVAAAAARAAAAAAGAGPAAHALAAAVPAAPLALGAHPAIFGGHGRQGRHHHNGAAAAGRAAQLAGAQPFWVLWRRSRLTWASAGRQWRGAWADGEAHEEQRRVTAAQERRARHAAAQGNRQQHHALAA